MTWRRALTAVALCTVTAASGCGSSGGAASTRAGDTTVLVSERTEDGMEALLAGRLEVVDGCLGLSGDVIVWPHGTKVVDEDPVTVDVPGVGRITLGDPAEIAGGFVHEVPGAEPRADLVVGGVAVPEACTHHSVALTHAGG